MSRPVIVVMVNKTKGVEVMRKAHEPGKSYGCDDCSYLKGKRCTLWEVKVENPSDNHCESHNVK